LIIRRNQPIEIGSQWLRSDTGFENCRGSACELRPKFWAIRHEPRPILASREYSVGIMGHCSRVPPIAKIIFSTKVQLLSANSRGSEFMLDRSSIADV
jgi:hypothetical protein